MDQKMILSFTDESNPPRPDKKTVERDTVQCIVRNPKDDTILALKWKKYDWRTFIIGGVEEGEDPVAAGKREVLEETGYNNLRLVGQLGPVIHSHYFAAHKDENRFAKVKGLYFELVDDARDPIDPAEAAQHEVVWKKPEEVPGFVKGAEVHELWKRVVEMCRVK